MSNQDKMQDEETLERARELVKSMESGDMSHASDLIRDLSRVREDSLFYLIGRLTRELHDSLKSFQDDSSMASITEVELPDARMRLDFVIKKTDEAATTTMDYIDKTLPISNELLEEAKDLHEEWSKFKRRELTVDEFRDLYENMMQFLQTTEHRANTIHDNMNEVLLAQGFQDITGQVIRKVITLVTDVEDSLVRLVKVAADAQKLSGYNPQANPGELQDIVEATGPHVEGTIANKNKEVVQNQDEVDDLLSSLGF